jgi:hypothetical protein
MAGAADTVAEGFLAALRWQLIQQFSCLPSG